jgi:uncharacterized membrane protein (UPF0127 family)
MTDTFGSTIRQRAAHCAALIFCGFLATAASLVVPAIGVQTVYAKMALETVWLSTSKGELAIEVEIAATVEESSVGLMFRTELAETKGMLFPSPAPREVGMWMRNTYIPLDMVFIRADGIVHRIEAMTEPLSETVIESRGSVLAVLELKGGAAAKFGLKPGDKVRHRIFGTAK